MVICLDHWRPCGLSEPSLHYHLHYFARLCTHHSLLARCSRRLRQWRPGEWRYSTRHRILGHERRGWCYPTGRCAYLPSVTCYRQSIKPPPSPPPPALPRCLARYLTTRTKFELLVVGHYNHEISAGDVLIRRLSPIHHDTAHMKHPVRSGDSRCPDATEDW